MDKAEYAVIVGVTNALMQVIKSVDNDGLFNRLYPVFTLAIGFVLGIARSMDWFTALTVGLTAMGFYRGFKVTMKGA